VKLKRKWIWIAAGVIVVAGGAGTWISRRGPKPTPVQTAVVGRQDLQAKVSANGKIQAQKKVDISATISGQVTHLAVKEGDRVAKGQLLLQIDAVTTRALARGSEASMQALQKELVSARASLLLAREDLRRMAENRRAGIVPDAELQRVSTVAATSEANVEALEQRVEQARATLEGAQDNLAKTTVRSPMDGIVTAKRIEEGEVAVIGVQNQPGTVLLTISDMSVVEAEMEVDETSIPSVAIGQKALVRVDAYPNRAFDARVTEVGNSPILRAQGVVTEAIKFKVKVQLDSPPEGIKPGLSVQADILTGFRPQALTVPIQALVVRDPQPPQGAASKPAAAREKEKEEEGVFVIENGKAQFRKIKTGLMGELSVEVTDGLTGGETIVSGPFRELRKLEPGAAVRPEKPEGAKSGATGERS